jgi:hypothetical protein
MNRTIGIAALLLAAASLSACGARKDPNMPTEEESQQLNNAAEMLDASPDSLSANEDVALGNGDQANAQDGDAQAAVNGTEYSH